MPGYGDSYILERNVVIKAVVIRSRLLRCLLLRLSSGLLLWCRARRLLLARCGVLLAARGTAIEQLHLATDIDNYLGGRRVTKKTLRTRAGEVAQ